MVMGKNTTKNMFLDLKIGKVNQLRATCSQLSLTEKHCPCLHIIPGTCSDRIYLAQDSYSWAQRCPFRLTSKKKGTDPDPAWLSPGAVS